MEDHIVQTILTGLGAPLSAVFFGSLSVKCFLEAKKDKEENRDPSDMRTWGIVLALVSVVLWCVWAIYGINLWQ